MKLKQIRVDGYKNLIDCEVNLSDFNVLVGPNNSGKSNAIDALRLLTPPLSGRRDIYCQLTDIRFDSGTGFDLSARYSDLNSAQQGRIAIRPLL